MEEEAKSQVTRKTRDRKSWKRQSLRRGYHLQGEHWKREGRFDTSERREKKKGTTGRREVGGRLNSSSS